MRILHALPPAGLTLALSLLAAGCGNSNFDPPSKITAVRILATQADKPYAQPGDMVTMQALAFDGRPKKPHPMNLYWVPIPCEDPFNDAYYGCYPGFAALLQPGVDLTPILMSGPKFTFQMPADVVTKHTGNRGTTPYGMVAIFTIACAGHVEYTPPPAGFGPNANPLGCFDDQHNALGADDYVFAYSYVFSFPPGGASVPAVTNTNPVIDHLSFGGDTVDIAAGITVTSCASGNCSSSPLGITVLPSSQEPDPTDVNSVGAPGKEQIWVDYYLTDGSVSSDAVILYDPFIGALPAATESYAPPTTPGENMLWAVVHDNRGGASWLQVPVHAK